MKEILFNIANYSLIDFCKSKGIDTSGSYTIKERGYNYNLIRQSDSKPIASVRFTKNSRPTYVIF